MLHKKYGWLNLNTAGGVYSILEVLSQLQPQKWSISKFVVLLLPKREMQNDILQCSWQFTKKYTVYLKGDLKKIKL